MDILAQLDAAFATTSSAKKQKISHGKQQKKRIDPVYAPLDEEWSSAVVQMKMDKFQNGKGMRKGMLLKWMRAQLPSGQADMLISSKIEKKMLKLENPTSLNTKNIPRLPKHTSLRKQKVFQMQWTYKMAEKQHVLWKKYMTLFWHKNNRHEQFMSMLSLCDWNGAAITVIKSQCPHYIHLEGIVVDVGQNSFKIVTLENKIKVVPKTVCTFQINIADRTLTISGSQLVLP